MRIIKGTAIDSIRDVVGTKDQAVKREALTKAVAPGVASSSRDADLLNQARALLATLDDASESREALRAAEGAIERLAGIDGIDSLASHILRAHRGFGPGPC